MKPCDPKQFEAMYLGHRNFLEKLDEAESVLEGIEETALENSIDQNTALKTPISATHAQITNARGTYNAP
jgi:hypothetical protein